MLQRMTNPQQNKDCACLTWARWPGVTVCRVSSASWRFKFLLEEEAITHGKQSNVICCDSSFSRWQMCCYFLDLLWNECVSVPLCLVCAGCPQSVIGPRGWTLPAPGCPGCDAGGHGQKSCPSSYAVPLWPAATLPPVTNTLSINVTVVLTWLPIILI